MLLMLKEREGYGYELLEKVHAFGFRSMPPDPAAIYRNLRHMENERWVKSTWDTKGTGPAKRIYRITPEGEESCTDGLSRSGKREALDQFMELYESYYKGMKDLKGDEPLGKGRNGRPYTSGRRVE